MKTHKECVHTMRFKIEAAEIPGRVLDEFRKRVAEHHPGLDQDIIVEKIEYGDPDGLGDLQRAQDLALRTRVQL